MLFNGAQIDLQTGNAFESDGVTPLATAGISFTPATIPDGEFLFYSVNLIPATVDPTTNRIGVQILILPGQGTNIALNNTPRAAFASGGIKLGQVYVQAVGSAIDVIQATNIRQLGVGSGSGGGGNGDANSFLEDLKARLRRAPFSWVNPLRS